jgi:hypothetical protein
MLGVAIASYFRDSQTWHGHRINQVDTYFKNVDREAGLAGVDPTLFLLEGDSKDDTWDALCRYRDARPGRVHLTKHEVKNAPAIASIVSEDRWRTLSEVGNVVLRQARDSGADVVYWTESDLLPAEGLLSSLLEHTKTPRWESTLAVAPLPVFQNGRVKHFYDTWAFEGINREKWWNHDLEKLRAYPARLRPMRSIGSCAILNGHLLRKFNLDFGTGCFPALCNAGRDNGLSIYCDVTLEIQHPCTRNIAGRLV